VPGRSSASRTPTPSAEAGLILTKCRDWWLFCRFGSKAHRRTCRRCRPRGRLRLRCVRCTASQPPLRSAAPTRLVVFLPGGRRSPACRRWAAQQSSNQSSRLQLTYRVLRFDCRSPADRRQAGLLRLRQKRGSSSPNAVTGGCFCRFGSKARRRTCRRCRPRGRLRSRCVRCTASQPPSRSAAPTRLVVFLPEGRRSLACRRWAAQQS
jgi:hypothetical protein